MSQILHISEAASLGLHTMGLLAAQSGEEKQTVKDMAQALKVSEAHLAKVMQKLSKAGLVVSRRGPGGGFVLADPCQEITLLDIFEALEGSLEQKTCLLEVPVCRGDCLFGGILERLGLELRDYLAATRLSDIKNVWLCEGCHENAS